MRMRIPRTIAALAITTALAGCTAPAATTLPGQGPLAQDPVLEAVPMLNHVQFGVFEQDIYVAKPGQQGVFRATPQDAAQDAVLDGAIYASATANAHDVTFSEVGPFAQGPALPFTLRQWLAGRGSAAYACTDGIGTVDASFAGLVPHGVYTFWDAVVDLRGGALTGAVDNPLGAADGSQSVFRADQDGNARVQVAWPACIPAATAGPGIGPDGQAHFLAIAWHRDGLTHGASPGPFGQTVHLQLFGLVRGANP
jgi:hypothetical protein